MIGFNPFKRSFSNNLDIIGSNEIGRYDVVSWGGFPGLGNMITSATFHNCGTYCNLNEALIRLVISINASFGSSHKICPVMRS